MRKVASKPTKRVLLAGAKDSVTCFYCPETFRRAQGRAAHIRYQHPGKPYRPDLKKARELKSEVADHAPTKPALPAPPQLEIAQPTDAMSPKQHLAAAIATIKRRQEATDRELPEVERHVDSLRAVQKQMAGDLQALETALATIDGSSVEQIRMQTGTVANAED